MLRSRRVKQAQISLEWLWREVSSSSWSPWSRVAFLRLGGQREKIKFKISISRMKLRTPVQPMRIGELGIGSFLVLVGGSSLVLCCVGSTFMQQPARNRVQIISTVTYGALIIYLTNAERRSPWEPQNGVSWLFFHRMRYPPQFTFVTIPIALCHAYVYKGHCRRR